MWKFREENKLIGDFCRSNHWYLDHFGGTQREPANTRLGSERLWILDSAPISGKIFKMIKNLGIQDAKWIQIASGQVAESVVRTKANDFFARLMPSTPRRTSLTNRRQTEFSEFNSPFNLSLYFLTINHRPRLSLPAWLLASRHLRVAVLYRQQSAFAQ